MYYLVCTHNSCYREIRNKSEVHFKLQLNYKKDEYEKYDTIICKDFKYFSFYYKI